MLNQTMVEHRGRGGKIIYLDPITAARRVSQNSRHRAWRESKRDLARINLELAVQLKTAKAELHHAKMNQPGSKQRKQYDAYLASLKARDEWYTNTPWLIKLFQRCPVTVPTFNPLWWDLN